MFKARQELDLPLLTLIVEEVGHKPRKPVASRIREWPSDDRQ